MGAAMTAPTTVWVLRHGQTAWNAEQRIQGHLDIGLDDTGRWQAQQLAQALHSISRPDPSGQGLPLQHIYSSDLQRAAATAQATAQLLGLPVVHDTRLRERAFGSFEGLTHTEVQNNWPEAAKRWRDRDPSFAPPGGETGADFYARCVGAATQLVAQHPGRNVALFAHGGVLDALYRAATHQSLQAPRTWQLGNATINRLLWTGEAFALVGWNDDSHLKS
jgi:2,3-bisphosphoglycerate-dependent phosphoglycerate mutase